jgi:hypothetical protein
MKLSREREGHRGRRKGGREEGRREEVGGNGGRMKREEE